MLSSITPVGEISRGRRWSTTTGAYLIASVAGGALTGTLFGAVGAGLARVGLLPSTPWSAVVLGAVALVGVALDVTGRLPLFHRQVNERWLTEYRGWVYGAGFGFQLGSGVVTIVPASITYVALVAASLTGSIPAACAIGASFGVVRALPVLAAARVRDPINLRELHRRLAGLAGAAQRATVGAQAVVALAALSFAVAVA